MKKNSAFTLRSGNRPSIAKLAGVSPVKKDFIGPIEPMVDKDKDNISDFIDRDGGSGQSNQDESKTRKTIKRKNKQGPKGLKTAPNQTENKKIVVPPSIKRYENNKTKNTKLTRGQVISAVINPFDIKNKIKAAKHYGPKIKKFLNTPVQKKR